MGQLKQGPERREAALWLCWSDFAAQSNAARGDDNTWAACKCMLLRSMIELDGDGNNNDAASAIASASSPMVDFLARMPHAVMAEIGLRLHVRDTRPIGITSLSKASSSRLPQHGSLSVAPLA